MNGEMVAMNAMYSIFSLLVKDMTIMLLVANETRFTSWFNIIYIGVYWSVSYKEEEQAVIIM